MAALLALLPLLGLWLLLSGFFTVLQLSLGLVSCAFVVWLAVRLDVLRADNLRLRLATGVGYWAWLAVEIVKSNLHVTRVVLARRMPLQRSVLRVRATQRSALGVAVYANSITLTPGTLTIDAEDDALSVHALTRAVADDLLSGEMDRRVTRLEGPGR